MFLQIKKLKTFKIHQMNVCQIMGRGGGLYRKNKIYEHISQQQMQNTVKKGKKKAKTI